jgi:hypothetical protein
MLVLFGFTFIRVLGYITFFYPDAQKQNRNLETHRHYTYKCYQIFVLLGILRTKNRKINDVNRSVSFVNVE